MFLSYNFLSRKFEAQIKLGYATLISGVMRGPSVMLSNFKPKRLVFHVFISNVCLHIYVSAKCPFITIITIIIVKVTQPTQRQSLMGDSLLHIIMLRSPIWLILDVLAHCHPRTTVYLLLQSYCSIRTEYDCIATKILYSTLLLYDYKVTIVYGCLFWFPNQHIWRSWAA